LVGLHSDHQLPTAGVHGAGVADLGVQRIRHDDGASERAELGLNLVQQWGEGGDLVRFRRDGDLGQDGAGVGVVCREQVHLPTIRQPCPAQQLAVHRDDHPVLAPRAGRAGRRWRSQLVNTACSTCASMRTRNRNTLLPAGIRPTNPSRWRAASSRSVAQSPIAANVLAPASTAHTATASRLVSR
jgi:hypothetical protein